MNKFSEIKKQASNLSQNRETALNIARNPELYRNLPEPIRTGRCPIFFGKDTRRWYCPWCKGELVVKTVINSTGSFMDGTAALIYYGCSMCDYEYGSWDLI